MPGKKVSENFFYSEFRPAGAPLAWMPVSEYQDELLKSLAANLQVVRDSMQQGSSITISCGVRVFKDYDRLKNAGYNPSYTSDHFCGLAVPVNQNSDKYKKFGPTYNFSVGAADCVPKGMTVTELFNLAVQLTKMGQTRFGQVIYEKDPEKNTEWIHFGGDPTPFFSQKILMLINRPKFLQSTDGGKSYKVPVII